MKENVIEWINGQDTISVTLHQGRYITKVEKLAKKFPKNRWVIPQIEAVIPDDSIDTFTGYDIEATCRKHVMTHPELEDKFNAIVDALLAKPE